MNMLDIINGGQKNTGILYGNNYVYDQDRSWEAMKGELSKSRFGESFMDSFMGEFTQYNDMNNYEKEVEELLVSNNVIAIDDIVVYHYTSDTIHSVTDYNRDLLMASPIIREKTEHNWTPDNINEQVYNEMASGMVGGSLLGENKSFTYLTTKPKIELSALDRTRLESNYRVAHTLISEGKDITIDNVKVKGFDKVRRSR